MKKFSKVNSHFSDQKGFTLIELLTVAAIFGIVGTIIVAVLFIGLRGGKKSDLLDVIRQNGNSALSQMERNIRFARSLDSLDANPASSCTGPAPVTAQSITVTSLSDALPTTYACIGGATPTIASNGASLINTNSITIPAGTCQFVCSQPTADDPPQITIQFTLQAKSTSTFTETNALIPFETSVTMRNVNQGL